MTAREEQAFDRRLFWHFWKIAVPYWRSSEKWTGRGLLLLLIVLLFGRTQFAVVLNEQSGELTSALAARDQGRFWHAIHVFGGALVAAVPTYATTTYVID